jgi:uncharacterized protein (TIGR03790 family)
MFCLTRLAGYDFHDVERMIDRSLNARNRGKFVFDSRAGDSDGGNAWLREAAQMLPKERVVIDETGRKWNERRSLLQCISSHGLAGRAAAA